MANNSIDTIIKMATELKAKMGEDEKQIPAWIQDHIAKAENYISQASGNYHEYGDSNESVNEAPKKLKHTISKKEWSKIPKYNKHIGMDGVHYIMKYDDKIGTYLQGVQIVDESVVKEISSRTPKIFVKTAAVEKKIKELMADRKKAVVPYNSETDPAKKEKLKQILIKLTNQIKGYEKNLVQLRDMEEDYLQQMHADAELDTTGL
jgi:flagellar biosynthesis chaperone FliJ